jgi:carboxyl-terminal processing protease
MLAQFFIAAVLLLVPLTVAAKVPEIEPSDVQTKLKEMMQAHATYKRLDQTLVKRALQNYLELLDPSKVYFFESDVKSWTDPSEALLQRVLDDYKTAKYTVFFDIQESMKKAILRRREWTKELESAPLPTKVDIAELKDLPWATDKTALMERLLKIRSLQRDAVEKLEPDLRKTSYQRIAKRQALTEEEILTKDAKKQRSLVLTNVLKATAASLDAHTSYFTPDEATQFMIAVQQRLFGIGAQLRDDINGLSVVKIVEGGPAAISGLLKLKDKIIAVNKVPVVGMDITEAVELIRGPEGTPVVLTILREEPEEERLASVQEAKGTEDHPLEIELRRGEVVIQEARYESTFEPFGDGVIGYLRLHSFYQDPEHTSASDLTKEIETLKRDHQVKGIILDLRGNTGGLLTQAVAVTGLFISKGVVVSIKDDTGNVQHLRDLDGKTLWTGPLVILIDRISASASEIVAQTLQDYGRALVVGDDHSYGKGSFQTFTLSGSKYDRVNPTGEYKVTRGSYYTVSGKTPQLVGVQSDVVIPGAFSQLDIGEKFLKYPLINDQIDPSFEDKMLDVPEMQRKALIALYRFDLQPKLNTYTRLLPQLKKNTEIRIGKNKTYQLFLEELKKKPADMDDELQEKISKNDLQLNEAYNVMKDLIVISNN